MAAAMFASRITVVKSDKALVDWNSFNCLIQRIEHQFIEINRSGDVSKKTPKPQNRRVML